MKYQPGTRVRNPHGVEGTVVQNVKMPGDICVKWDFHEGIYSYDEDVMDESCTIVEVAAPAQEGE